MRLVLANSLGPDNDELVSALEGFLCHDAAGAVWIDNHDHLVSIHHKCRRSISRSRLGCILRRGRGHAPYTALVLVLVLVIFGRTGDLKGRVG